MAIMYPRKPHGAKSHGEVELFHALEAGLDDSYQVYYSVAWLAPKRPGKQPADGESDFVILHPRKGLLTIEVKGGQISYDPADGWYTLPYGASHRESIRDPLEQAKDNKYSLRRKLQSLPGWRGRFILDGHAVAFPDGVPPAYPPRPDAQPVIMLSALDLPHIARRIDEIYSFWSGEEPQDRFSGFDRAAEALITETLGRSWDLRAPRLSEKMTLESEHIVRLTEKQFDLLGFLAEHRRAAIAGPAGSGKTMIALEKARRLAEEGFRTLLICFNRPLADYLRTVVPAKPDLVINSFHRFCGEVTHGRLQGVQETEEFYRVTLPDALVDAIADIPEEQRFDALVIDEGQDFRAEWLGALEFLLADRGQSILYIFYDDNQNIYNCDLSHLGLASPFRLYENCRNTKHVFDMLLPYYRGTHEIRCDGPNGDPVSIRRYDSQTDLVEQLVLLTADLVFAEGVPTKSMVLLSPHNLARGPLSGVDHLGYFSLTEEARPTDRQLQIMTIHRFKGLERPIVILLLADGDQDRAELLYVGMSRASNRLYIFIPAGKMKLRPPAR